MAGVNGSATLKTDLHVWFDLESDFNDDHTNGYNMTSAEAAIDSGEYLIANGSARFETGDDETFTGTGGSDVWSLNFWYKHNGTIGSGIKRISSGILVCLNNNTLSMGSSAFYDGYDIGAKDDGDWHMYTWIVDDTAGTITTLMDGDWAGRDVQTGITSGEIDINFDDFGGSTSGLDGWVNYIGFWEKNLTESEVSELYNSGLGISYASTPSSGSAPEIRLTKSPLLQKYSLPAERARGLVFVEKFASEADVEANGGEISGGGDYSFSNGTFSRAENKYILYDKKYFTFGENDFSLSFWVKPATLDSQYFLYSSSGGVRLIVSIESGVLRALLDDSSSSNTLDSSVDLVADEWNHICLVRDADGDTSLYVNGELGDSAATNTADMSMQGTLAVGISVAAEQQYRDVRWYSEALSAQEASDLANNSTFNYLNRQPNLIVPMTMDKHLGDTLLDNQLESWAIRGPVKQASRGYFFDGTDDRIVSGSKTNLPTAACTFIVLVEPQYDVATDSYTWVLGNQSSLNAIDGAMLYSRGAAGWGWVFSVNQYSGTVSGSATARSGNAVIPDGPAVLVGVYDKTEERIEIWINGENQTNTAVKTGPWEDINNVRDRYVIGQILDSGAGLVYSFEGNIGFSAVLPFALNPTQIKDISALLKRTQQEV